MENKESRERSRSQSKESREDPEEAGSGEEDDPSDLDSQGSQVYDHENHESLEELYTTLIEYKNNLFKIEALISIEKKESEMAVLVNCKNQLNQAIQYQEGVIKLKQKSDGFLFNVERMRPDFVDRVVGIYSGVFCLAS